MTEPELWAARDSHLCLRQGEPDKYTRSEATGVQSWWGMNSKFIAFLPWDLLPDLAPGSNCRVKIVRIDCTCPTLDGVQVTGSGCPVHGLESGKF